MGFWQYAVSPRRQVSQVPSSPPKNPTPTRWPTFQVVTRRPTSSMQPIASWPGTRGYTTPGSCPSTVPASEWHTPQASTRIRTCSSPGPTTGLSTRRKIPGLVISTALYVFPILASYRSGRTHVSSFTRTADKRQVENSPLLAILALMSRDRTGSEDAFVTNYASPIVLEVSILVLIESAAVWRFCWALGGGNANDALYFSSGAGRLNAFGIGAFALRHRPGEVPTISRNLRLKAGWSVNPTSNATVSKESFECNKRDFAASTRL